MYNNSAIRVIHIVNTNQWSHPSCTASYPHQGNWELTACPKLLRDGSVRSDQELNPGPLGLGANVLTTTPSRLTDESQLTWNMCIQLVGASILLQRK
jgi:hypothetical protein